MEYLGANAAPDGSYRLAAMHEDGREVFETRLPGRAHAVVVHPARREAVVFARRPGTFGIVLDTRDGGERFRLRLPAGRHFYGHGAFSRNGALLYTTENDFEAGRGIVGVWDARDGYRRVREMPSHGIGPHELAFAGDGRTLIVANGGILTHPDTGRRKLNIPTMAPSLAYIEADDGRLQEAHGFDDPRHRLLSIRHIAVNAGGVVCVALQDEGHRGDHMPLVAFHRRGEPGLDLRAPPPSVLRRMRGYTGAAAKDTSGRFAAVSAPRGGLVTLWDAARRAFVDAVDLADACGVAPARAPGRFFVTSGTDGALRVDALAHGAERITRPFVMSRHWDNHLAALPPDA